jgi:hypothetical protein
MNRKVVLISLSVGLVVLLAVLAPRAGSYLLVEREWVGPSVATVGSCSIHRLTGRLHGLTEVWDRATGALVAQGTIRNGRGELRWYGPHRISIEASTWSIGSIADALWTFEYNEDLWRHSPDTSRNTADDPKSLAPWTAAQMSHDEWWTTVSAE